jgi:catechol 2,3-dioxygenase-like lactoylglutathione lyase family enzyme
MDRPAMTLTAVVLGARDPHRLAQFYQDLLGWPVRTDEPDWVTLAAPGGAGLSFQEEVDHVPPAWPADAGDQQMMMHLDIEVEDLAAACEYALGCGATLAGFQPQENVRVLLDPAGHPFCIWVQL